MMLAMLAMGGKDQVEDRIVGSVMVPMVDDLIGLKLTPQVLLHDKPMFKDSSPFVRNVFVSVWSQSTTPIGIFDAVKPAVSVVPEVVSIAKAASHQLGALTSRDAAFHVSSIAHTVIIGQQVLP